MIKKSLVPVYTVIVLLLGMSFLSKPAQSLTAPSTPPVSGQWRAVFLDEFTTLSPTIWQNCTSWSCTDDAGHPYLTSNETVSGGELHLGATADSASLLRTETGFSFTYGYVEARLKIPAGQGLWPAFWMLDKVPSGPNQSEIDILEALGQNPSIAYLTVHANNSVQDGSAVQGPDLSAGFHTFGVDWEPTSIVWYIDGVAKKTVTNPAFLKNTPMYLLLNLAVGGAWPGPPNASTPFPAELTVQYVKVWQRGPAALPTPLVPSGSLCKG